jgi:diadenylate cyclase
VIVFQPELRKVLESLGERELLNHSFLFGSTRNYTSRFSDRTLEELVRASMEMSAERTGALIVIEQNENLREYERTGIEIDALVTSQLLINIFEHNTPLHDGAVIIRGDRVTAATCYLPLSDNKSLSKALGTRHRAGVGVSEATDSLTIIVSEETGGISMAYRGTLQRNVTEMTLRDRLIRFLTQHCVYPAGPKTFYVLMERLAEELNDSRLNVSRVLNQLQYEGLVELHRGRVVIHQLERLIM